jgi:hypothetical protein
MQLPWNTTDDRVEFLVNDMFNGSITHYKIGCPYCGNEIKLIDYINPLSSINSTALTKRFFNLKQKNLIVNLTYNRLEFYNYDYVSQGSVNISITNISCTNL